MICGSHTNQPRPSASLSDQVANFASPCETVSGTAGRFLLEDRRVEDSGGRQRSDNGGSERQPPPWKRDLDRDGRRYDPGYSDRWSSGGGGSLSRGFGGFRQRDGNDREPDWDLIAKRRGGDVNNRDTGESSEGRGSRHSSDTRDYRNPKEIEWERGLTGAATVDNHRPNHSVPRDSCPRRCSPSSGEDTRGSVQQRQHSGEGSTGGALRFQGASRSEGGGGSSNYQPQGQQENREEVLPWRRNKGVHQSQKQQQYGENYVPHHTPAITTGGGGASGSYGVNSAVYGDRVGTRPRDFSGLVDERFGYAPPPPNLDYGTVGGGRAYGCHGNPEIIAPPAMFSPYNANYMGGQYAPFNYGGGGGGGGYGPPVMGVPPYWGTKTGGGGGPPPPYVPPYPLNQPILSSYDPPGSVGSRMRSVRSGAGFSLNSSMNSCGPVSSSRPVRESTSSVSSVSLRGGVAGRSLSSNAEVEINDQEAGGGERKGSVPTIVKAPLASAGRVQPPSGRAISDGASSAANAGGRKICESTQVDSAEQLDDDGWGDDDDGFGGAASMVNIEQIRTKSETLQAAVAAMTSEGTSSGENNGSRLSHLDRKTVDDFNKGGSNNNATKEPSVPESVDPSPTGSMSNPTPSTVDSPSETVAERLEDTCSSVSQGISPEGSELLYVSGIDGISSEKDAEGGGGGEHSGGNGDSFSDQGGKLEEVERSDDVVVVSNRESKGGPPSRSSQASASPAAEMTRSDPASSQDSLAPGTAGGSASTSAASGGTRQPWRPGRNMSRRQIAERQITALLNKLTVEKFPVIVEKLVLLQESMKEESDLKDLVDLVMDKAVMEPDWSEMHADLCQVLKWRSVDVWGASTQSPVSRALLSKIQQEYERMPRTIGLCAEDKQNLDENEQHLKLKKVMKRVLGVVKLIGELFHRRMIPFKVMNTVVMDLVVNREEPDEHFVECFCQLISTTGYFVDQNAQFKPVLDSWFGRLKELQKKKIYSKRMQCVLQDVLDLRKANWHKKIHWEQAKSLCELREKAENEEYLGGSVVAAQYGNVVVVGQRSNMEAKGPYGEYIKAQEARYLAKMSK